MRTVESDPQALALVEGLDSGTIAAAFDALDDVPHEVRFMATSTQADQEPFVSSMRLHREAGAENYDIVSIDTSGAVSAGIFSAFHPGRGEPDVTSLPDIMLEEDPPFFDARNRAAFIYSTAGDTLIDGRPVQVIAIERAPGEDRGKPYEAVRLYVDGQALIGIYMLIDERTLFFGDRSERRIFLSRDLDGKRLPREIEVRSNIKNFLSSTRQVTGEWLIEAAPAGRS